MFKTLQLYYITRKQTKRMPRENAFNQWPQFQLQWNFEPQKIRNQIRTPITLSLYKKKTQSNLLTDTLSGCN